MSLVMALSNSNGIVISADRRVTRDPSDGKSSLLLTDNERKLFITKSGHAIANVGSLVLKNSKSSSSLILDIIEQLEPTLTLSQELIIIKNKLLENMFDGDYICLIGAAIENR